MSKQTPPTTRFQKWVKIAILNTRFLNFEQRFAIWGVDFSKYYLLRWKRTQAVLPLAAREAPPLHPAGGGADLWVTVLAGDVTHVDDAVACAGIIPLVFLRHLRNTLAPAAMEFAGVGIDHIVAVRRGCCGAGGLI